MKNYLLTILLTIVMIGCTGIHNDVKYNRMAQVRKFVRTDGRINIRQKSDGFTPLMVAAYYNIKEPAVYLLKQGANVNAQDNEGLTALMYACLYGYYDMAKRLLDHKAVIDIEDDYGLTVAAYAAESDNPDMEALLKQYPDNLVENLPKKFRKKKRRRHRKQHDKNRIQELKRRRHHSATN